MLPTARSTEVAPSPAPQIESQSTLGGDDPGQFLAAVAVAFATMCSTNFLHASGICLLAADDRVGSGLSTFGTLPMVVLGTDNE
jgi:hypothetical protein